MSVPLVNIHTHRPTGEGIELADTVGIHPWRVGEIGEPDGGVVLREVETECARAIGETGLDFSPSVASDHGLQKMAFAAQLRIAEVRKLPVIVHCVKAFEPTMEILSGFRLPAVIFHGFIGSHEQAARAVRAGYFLSFGGRSFDSPKTLEAMTHTPLSQLFLETDDSPTPIAEVYARAAEILGIPTADLAERILQNYLNIFPNEPYTPADTSKCVVATTDPKHFAI